MFYSRIVCKAAFKVSSLLPFLFALSVELNLLNFSTFSTSRELTFEDFCGAMHSQKSFELTAVCYM